MKVGLIVPIEWLKGRLRQDGYYFRMYRGQQIVQRCPNRTGHVKTAGEAANQKEEGRGDEKATEKVAFSIFL